MATSALGGAPAHTVGELPAVGSPAPAFTLSAPDLSDVTSDQFAGRKLLLNIFPSVGTGVCAASVRRVQRARRRAEGTTVLCVSHDLPFALARVLRRRGHRERRHRLGLQEQLR